MCMGKQCLPGHSSGRGGGGGGGGGVWPGYETNMKNK